MKSFILALLATTLLAACEDTKSDRAPTLASPNLTENERELLREEPYDDCVARLLFAASADDSGWLKNNLTTIISRQCVK